MVASHALTELKAFMASFDQRRGVGEFFCLPFIKSCIGASREAAWEMNRW